jgi:hypothetical protein
MVSRELENKPYQTFIIIKNIYSTVLITANIFSKVSVSHQGAETKINL